MSYKTPQLLRLWALNIDNNPKHMRYAQATPTAISYQPSVLSGQLIADSVLNQESKSIKHSAVSPQPSALAKRPRYANG
ncbi:MULTISPECIES: hypothetical protein [Moorena]|uniref:hypothetical protein n=1 Tax=Moorena TaxID=1155738 RepID=UPI001055C389|nr:MULTISPECIES: hypothetical protein [Moorena]NEQ15113.1 hypothetical protein [Moorena sp. SIO3E2]NEP34320.1 hypothetical protein [Moorena sp. SIO3B2]NEP70218.1 hypothetical protein [Moorena sp. SIO3A5]NEQ09136.1 hypothetical protein [Moorena sp. SIO4E2]NER92172.1 hypothetical protein [Moorena sp. SIO3A2]